MKCEVLVRKEIEIKPGDKVKLYNVYDGYYGYNREAITTIKKVIESRNKTYCLFNGGYMYRPMTTYGITWKKVD